MNRFERRAINRANATFSTGPKTETGKETSKLNALKHGLCAAKPCLTHEQHRYDAYSADRLRTLNPETSEEIVLAHTIVDLEWRLRRIPTLETLAYNDLQAGPHKIIKSLETLSRHEGRLRKLLATAKADLKTLLETRRNQQKEEALPENGFVLQAAAHGAPVSHPSNPLQPSNAPETGEPTEKSGFVSQTATAA